MDDETLIKACVSGNEKAQFQLFEQFAPKMMAVCLRYAENREMAEDVLQESFVKVFKNLKKFTNEGSLDGWIRRIMVNTSLDAIRKNKKRKFDSQIESISYLAPQNDFIEESLMAEDLMLIINQMPEGYKLVFNLYAIEGYSHKEIAETLGISENTSKSQYSRARAYLREILEKKGIGR
jgi:RNA polymerase sigma-70 factor (ECF subfamily)